MNKFGQLAPYTGEGDSAAPTAQPTKRNTNSVVPADVVPYSGEAAPATTTNQAPTHGSNYTQPASNDSVVKMQSKLIDLYQTIKADPKIQGWLSGKESSAAGFMLNRYIDKEKKSNLAPSFSADSKTSSFAQCMNLLQSVGSAGKLNKPDGRWGPLTDNALKAALAIGFAMLFILEKLGKLDIKKFPYLTSQNLEALEKMITPSYDGKAAKNADAITGLLEKIQVSVKEFIAIMSETNSDYNEKKFNVFQGSKTFTPEEQELFNKLCRSNSIIPGIKSTLQGITYNDISSLENFTKFVKSKQAGTQGEQLGGLDAVKQYRNELKAQLEKLTSSGPRQGWV